MACLWAVEEPMSIRRKTAIVNIDRALAYSTGMAVLDHLHRKDVLLRKKSGRAWGDVPEAPRSVDAAELMEPALDSNSDWGSALLAFVEQPPRAEVAQSRRVWEADIHTSTGSSPRLRAQ